jgi:hypothetical protein
MSKHTPGPWLMDEEGQIFSRGELVATVNARQYAGEPTWNLDQASADAALIATAPELLSLVMTANSGLKGTHTIAWQEAARAAIQKATGEQQ